MLEANRLVLEDIERSVEGELVDSKVEGRVVVEAGARLERAVVRGPAIIGAGARITDAYVGPYTVDRRRASTVERAEVEHSILLAGVERLRPRRRAWRRACSAATSRSRAATALPKTLRMIVGDNSEITIP